MPDKNNNEFSGFSLKNIALRAMGEKVPQPDTQSEDKILSGVHQIDFSDGDPVMADVIEMRQALMRLEYLCLDDKNPAQAFRDFQESPEKRDALIAQNPRLAEVSNVSNLLERIAEQHLRSIQKNTNNRPNHQADTVLDI